MDIKTLTKGEMYHKEFLKEINTFGTIDENPRPHYKDGTPALQNLYLIGFNSTILI